MVSSFLVSVGLLILHRNGVELKPHMPMLITIAITTVCWVAAAYLAPQTNEETLIAFYKRVRPFGPGWKYIRLKAGISETEATTTGENIPMALLGWVAGCTVIWSGLFSLGNFIYGRTGMALLLAAVFTFSSLVLIYVVNKLWAPRPTQKVKRKILEDATPRA